MNNKTKINGQKQVTVTKEGHYLEARELNITEEQGTQRMTAFGPGEIKLFDKAAKEQSSTATWQDQLTTSKDGDQDLLVLTGQATYKDTERQQFLTADKLRVWLEAGGSNAAQSAAAAGRGQNSRRPQR